MYQSMSLGLKQSIAAVTLVNLEMMLILLITISSAAIILVLSESLPLLSIMTAALSVVVLTVMIRNCLTIKALTMLSGLIPKLRDLIPPCKVKPSAKFTLGFYVAFLLSYLVSHWLFLYALMEVSWHEYVWFTACLALAWVLGVITLVFPGGIGIREFVFIVSAGQLPDAPDLEVLGTIAVFSRLWLICQELLGVVFISGLNYCKPYQE